jgi:hypothetical protein
MVRQIAGCNPDSSDPVADREKSIYTHFFLYVKLLVWINCELNTHQAK